MLTLYGDYVRYRGQEIGIGSLIRLLGNFDLSELSIRSAVSRMCRAGLLKVRHDGARSYYSLTEDGLVLLQEGERRIFERKVTRWNGEWSVIVYFIPEDQREARDALRRELTWMGYGPLNTATWISPYDLSKDVGKLARRLKIKEFLQVFQARHLGFSDPKALVARGWDLHRIHRGYAAFIAGYRTKLDGHLVRLNSGGNIEPSECFAERFKLIHEYRRLPFFDPDLPEELLPGNWLRSEAGALFNEYHDLLADKANRYFDSVLKAY
jgi:phenylacetic acid degradation operon negative regulatory protein